MRRADRYSKIPTPVKGEIAFLMLTSMCSFGMVVSSVKFCVNVGGEGHHGYNRVTLNKIQVKTIKPACN